MNISDLALSKSYSAGEPIQITVSYYSLLLRFEQNFFLTLKSRSPNLQLTRTNCVYAFLKERCPAAGRSNGKITYFRNNNNSGGGGKPRIIR